jgi:NAD(P)-dependent dehydrogenase (short-subunit alcohol dehydrogenase family)
LLCLKRQTCDHYFQIGVAAANEDDSLETSNLQVFQRTFAVNTFGVFLFTQALLPNVLVSSSPKIGIVSSRVGSVADNSTGGHYAYRSSKAAVNSIGKSLAVELKDKGVTVMLLHPGIVQSNLLPMAKMPPEAVMPEEAARKLWENIVSKKTIEDTGKFWHREGFELPW